MKMNINQTIEALNKLDEAVIRCDAVFRSLELLVNEYMQANLDTTLEQGLMYQLTDIRRLTKDAEKLIEKEVEQAKQAKSIA